MSDLPISVVAGLLGFSILILVHEFGHYLAARWAGVKVLRFSLGFGPVLWSRKWGRDQTEWALSAFPLGGYVKMVDVRNDDQVAPEDLPREFTRQPFYKRAVILIAGPAANFVMAVLVFALLFTLGSPQPVARLHTVAGGTAAFEAGLRGGELVTAIEGEKTRSFNDLRMQLLTHVVDHRPVHMEVERAGIKSSVDLSMSSLTENDLSGDFLVKLGLMPEFPRPRVMDLQAGPAQAAGLKVGDLILSVQGVVQADMLQFQQTVARSPRQPLNIRVERDNQLLDFSVTPAPRADNPRIGMIGVELPAPEWVLVKETPPAALVRSVRQTWDTSVLQLRLLGKLVTGEFSWRNVTGPITIVDYSGKAARHGFLPFLNFIAFVSVSLGVMNLLPIPILDGGFLLYYSLEVLTRRTFSERFSDMFQRAGFSVIAVLMLVALRNDVMRLLH